MPFTANAHLSYVQYAAARVCNKSSKKYGFKVLRILTSINLGKSRQTNAIIPSGIIREFNDDLANFAPLKLNLFNSRSAWGLPQSGWGIVFL